MWLFILNIFNRKPEPIITEDFIKLCKENIDYIYKNVPRSEKYRKYDEQFEKLYKEK